MTVGILVTGTVPTLEGSQSAFPVNTGNPMIVADTEYRSTDRPNIGTIIEMSVRSDAFYTTLEDSLVIVFEQIVRLTLSSEVVVIPLASTMWLSWSEPSVVLSNIKCSSSEGSTLPFTSILSEGRLVTAPSVALCGTVTISTVAYITTGVHS